MTLAKTILIVDDDIDIRETLRIILEEANYAVAEAANGQDALDYLSSCGSLPNLILLDLAMPVMSGGEFRARQLQDDQLAAIPTIVLTAAAEPEKRAAPLKPVCVIPKPFDLFGLLDVVAATLAAIPKEG